MRNILPALVLLLFICLQGCDTALKKSNPAGQLAALFEDYKEYFLREFPENATYDGDHRYDDRLMDASDAAEKARLDSLRSFLSRAHAIDIKWLDKENRLSYQLFCNQLQDAIDGARFRWHYMPLTQQDGIHIVFPQIIEIQPFKTKADFQNYQKRLQAFPRQVHDIIANMRLGIAAKLVIPAFSVQQILEQIKPFISLPADSLPFAQPLAAMDSTWPAAQQQEIKDGILQAISTNIIPAYQKLADFLGREYMPHARTQDGIWSLPDGAERYAWAIRTQTTTTMSAEEIYQLGLQEVKRITAQMEQIKQKAGFQGSLKEFNQFLLKDPRFIYTDKNLMLQDYKSILHKVDSQLPKLFGRLPKAAYALKEIEAYRAASAPQAYYYGAPLDRSRPGYFYVNTYDLASRPRFTMTALALHEAVPGHHLQISIAQELDNLPWVRRQMGFNAFVEGWALYAESLGDEMKLYDDPYQHYGALNFEMWRACRLVVDAGIHARKMTREQAVQYMLEHAGNSELDTRSEVDRYIVWPGQALAYKIGQITISNLRKEAQKKMGSRFNLSAFHDKVLGSGAIPLDILRGNIQAWIHGSDQ
jgi:uncharacterized protein (DUF885 family)